MSRTHERLSLQPGECGHLVFQLLGTQQANHGFRCKRFPAARSRRLDFIHDVRTCVATQTLPTPVRREERPATSCEHRPDKIEGLIVESRRGAVIVKNDRKRPRTSWLVHQAMKHLAARVE